MTEDYRFSEEFLGPPLSACNCDSQLKAEKMFRQRNFYGETNLEMLTTYKNERFLYWTCRKDKKLLISIPVFFDSIKLSGHVTTVINKTIMHQNGGYFYYILKGKDDKFTVRSIKVFASEEDVREYCLLKQIHYQIGGIKMHYITTVQENRKIAVCWTIASENADGGRTVTLLPVCWSDRIKLSQYNLNSLNVEPVNENDIVYLNDKLYFCRKVKNEYEIQRCRLQLVR